MALGFRVVERYRHCLLIFLMSHRGSVIKLLLLNWDFAEFKAGFNLEMIHFPLISLIPSWELNYLVKRLKIEFINDES